MHHVQRLHVEAQLGHSKDNKNQGEVSVRVLKSKALKGDRKRILGIYTKWTDVLDLPQTTTTSSHSESSGKHPRVTEQAN